MRKRILTITEIEKIKERGNLGDSASIRCEKQVTLTDYDTGLNQLTLIEIASKKTK